MSTDYDLITIGAGSGGVAASRRAAALGARVLIVEGDRVGGTCVIRGCVPKKLMMYAAGFSGALREAAGFGWTDIGGRFEMSRWADAKAREIDRLEGIYRDMLRTSGVELAVGQARLAGLDSVEVGGRSHRAPRVLIATGGAPRPMRIPGLELAMTSNDVLDAARGAGVGAGDRRRIHRRRVREHSVRTRLAGDARLPRCAAAARLRRRPAQPPRSRA